MKKANISAHTAHTQRRRKRCALFSSTHIGSPSSGCGRRAPRPLQHTPHDTLPASMRRRWPCMKAGCAVSFYVSRSVRPTAKGRLRHALQGKICHAALEQALGLIAVHTETRESCIRDFQLENLRASGIEYTTCICNSSSIFYMLLVPIGKGLIISPMPLMNAPPNTVCLPLTDVSYTASSALFYSRSCRNPEVEPFVSSFLQFTKEASHHEHRKTL